MVRGPPHAGLQRPVRTRRRRARAAARGRDRGGRHGGAVRAARARPLRRGRVARRTVVRSRHRDRSLQRPPDVRPRTAARHRRRPRTQPRAPAAGVHPLRDHRAHEPGRRAVHGAGRPGVRGGWGASRPVVGRAKRPRSARRHRGGDRLARPCPDPRDRLPRRRHRAVRSLRALADPGDRGADARPAPARSVDASRRRHPLHDRLRACVRDPDRGRQQRRTPRRAARRSARRADPVAAATVGAARLLHTAPLRPGASGRARHDAGRRRSRDHRRLLPPAARLPRP